MLHGTVRVRIEDDGALMLPPTIRERLTELGDNEIVVTQSFDGGLTAYPRTEWLEMLDRFRQQPKFEGEVTNIGRVFVGRGHECAVDAQGCIHLPAALMQEAELDHDVVLSGAGTHFAILSRADWMSRMQGPA